MSPTRLLGPATVLVALVAVSGATAGPTAGPRPKTDRGTAAVATTPRTSGTTQYVAGFNSDAMLGDGAVTYVITAIPSSAKGSVSLVARDVRLYTGTGELTGTATATLTAAAGGHAVVRNGRLVLDRGRGSLAGHSLTATFSGAGQLGGGYTFTYRGTYR